MGHFDIALRNQDRGSGSSVSRPRSARIKASQTLMGRKSQLLLPRSQSLPHATGKPVRIEQAPQPDVRIQKQPHLTHRFPIGEI